MARNILEIIGGQILSSSSAVASYPMRGLWRWDERRAGPKGHAGCEIPQRGPLHWKRSGRRDYRASQTRSEVYDEAEEAAGSARSLRTSPCPDSEAPPRRGRRLPPTPPPRGAPPAPPGGAAGPARPRGAERAAPRPARPASGPAEGEWRPARPGPAPPGWERRQRGRCGRSALRAPACFFPFQISPASRCPERLRGWGGAAEDLRHEGWFRLTGFQTAVLSQVLGDNGTGTEVQQGFWGLPGAPREQGVPVPGTEVSQLRFGYALRVFLLSKR